MKEASHKPYPKGGKRPVSRWPDVLAFAQANRQRALFDCDIPDWLRENIDTYLPEIKKAGYRLLSAETHPDLLVQGQFMFWPVSQGNPVLVPPGERPFLQVADNRPIGIDLFAGAGGLSMGFEQAGFDIAACVEIDPIHCATHEYNFPYASSICASVTALTGDAIRRKSGIGKRDIDVVFGGAPCQGFSMIGKRALDDPRNRLVFHYVRLVKELRPKYCVFENVKGLTVGKQVQFLKELIAALEESGYRVVLPYQVLNAASYGVPQNRFRLFLLAYRDGQTAPDYPLPHAGRVTVAEAISDLPDADHFGALLQMDDVPVCWQTVAAYARKLRLQMEDPLDCSHPRQFNRDELTCSLRTIHTAKSMERFTATKPGTTEPISRFFKLPLDGQCNTLRAGTDSARGAFTSPRPIHPLLPRVITVREAARLHSYPDWFRFHATKWHGFRQIGNSVPPLLGRAVAGRIMKALGLHPTKPTVLLSPGDRALLSFNMRQAADHFGVSTLVIGQRTRKKDGELKCVNR
jgi:DNA (cytosine-5)-methyltransferase 1